MQIESRTLHPEQISTNTTLRAAQYRMLEELWCRDLEIYDDEGNLVAITSKDNPNLDQLLAQLGSEPNASGGIK